MLSILSLALVAFVSGAPSPQATTTTTGVFDPISPICLSPIYTGTPPNITAITPGTLVTGLKVNNNNGTASLDSEGLDGRLVFDEGTIGAYLGHCTPYYLNIGGSTHSYKPLTWSFEQVTDIWDANFTEIITAKKTASYKATSEFLACKPLLANLPIPWTLYLQTGSDKPPTGACATTQLYVSKNGLHLVGATD